MYRRIRMPSPLLHCLVVSLSLDFLCRCSPFLANLSWPLFLGRLSSSFALRFVLSRPQPKSLSPLFVTYPLVITIITDGSLVHVFLSLSLSDVLWSYLVLLWTLHRSFSFFQSHFYHFNGRKYVSPKSICERVCVCLSISFLPVLISVVVMWTLVPIVLLAKAAVTTTSTSLATGSTGSNQILDQLMFDTLRYKYVAIPFEEWVRMIFPWLASTGLSVIRLLYE